MSKMKWRELAVDPLFNVACYLDVQDKAIEEKDKEIARLNIENEKLYMFIYDYTLCLEHMRDNGSKKYIKENLDLVIKYMEKEFKEYYKLKGKNSTYGKCVTRILKESEEMKAIEWLNKRD